MPSSWACRNEDSAGLRRWERLLPEFLTGHRRAPNVGLHLLTTPPGLLASVSLIYLVAPSLAVGVVVAYVLALAIFLPPRVWCVTAAVLTAIVAATVVWPLGLITSLVLFAVAFVLQKVAHLLTGEKALQSSYMGSRTWWLQMSEHAFFLLPLVLAAAFRYEGSIFSFLYSAQNAVFDEIGCQEIRAAIGMHPEIRRERATFRVHDDTPLARGAKRRRARRI